MGLCAHIFMLRSNRFRKFMPHKQKKAAPLAVSLH